MKIRNKFTRVIARRGYALLGLCALGIRTAAALPADWQSTQTFEVAAPGLVKFSLPTDTLSAARPALEDLRLHDANGNELPFFIERPTPGGKTGRAAKSFSVALNPTSTVITLETGLTQPLDGVALESHMADFIKPVRVEASNDGQNWQTVADRQPIFCQSSGANQKRIAIPAAAWRWLRLTVDDKRTLPVPFTGATVFAAAAEPTPSEWQSATIVERIDNPGMTRLTLDLGAANLDVASVKIESSDPLFTRTVWLREPVLAEAGVNEQDLGAGSIYRVAGEGCAAAENLSVALETRVKTHELIVVILNQDSPPLAITGVRVERRPVYCVFNARAAGTYRLLTGNSRCAAPRYDLAALGGDLKRVAATAVKVSAVAVNPDFRAPEALAGVELAGTALDVKDWKFRKAVKISAGGAQQLELDLDVLAHAVTGFADLRLMRGSNQVPFIIHHTSINRKLTPAVTLTNDTKRPKLSRWVIKLPQAGLPLYALSCKTSTTVFERKVTLYEELTDGRGEKYRKNFAEQNWTQTPVWKISSFTVGLKDRIQTDTLFLETDNGDNPPIILENFSVAYAATRILFKAQAGEPLFLYYGNPRVAPPQYDLALVAGQLLAAGKSPAALAGEESLQKSGWREAQVPGKGGVLLWAALAAVVVGLLVVIAKLLPKSPPPA